MDVRQTAPSCFVAFSKKVWIVLALKSLGEAERAERAMHSPGVMPRTLITGSGSRVSTASSKGSSSEEVYSLIALTRVGRLCKSVC